MAKRPEDAPLGATPMLPPPSGAAAERAEGAFKDYLERMRAEGSTLESPSQLSGVPAAHGTLPQPPPVLAANASSPAPDSFGGGRRYDVALSKVGMAQSSSQVAPERSPASTQLPDWPPPYPDPSSDEARDPEPPASSPAETSETPQPAARPPAGVPFVRPTVPAAVGPEAVSQALLESAADSAMLRTDPDGTSSFDIAFSDELFSDLACRVTVVEGRVVATFRVHDDNTRRLIEAEAGRLRVRLEERGLRVQEVRVEQES